MKHALVFVLLSAPLFCGSAAWGQDDSENEVEDTVEEIDWSEVFQVGGNVKTFGTFAFPYEHLLMPEDPSVSGVVSGRLKLEIFAGDHVRIDIHPIFVAQSAAGGFAGLSQSGVGQSRPEAVDLSWDIADSQLGSMLLMLDRLSLRLSMPHADITLGRQAVSFGQGYFFTPMDLVTAFSPGTIDREYKPGIDAVRFDAYWGVGSSFTAVAAYAGDWELEQTIFASHIGTSWDNIGFGLFGAYARKDIVVGFDLIGDFFGASVFAESTFTFPDPEEIEEGADGAFIRALAGTSISLPNNVSLLFELYGQSLGMKDPKNYLEFATGDRMSRGELWLMGQLYAAGSVGFEITPMVRPSIFAIVNLYDPSVLFGPALGWSVSDEVQFGFGSQISIGRRPRPLEPIDLLNQTTGIPLPEASLGDLLRPRSEFGIYPSVVYVTLSAYF